MKTKLIKLISILCVICMLGAMLAACGEPNETTKETEKETVKETEKETVKETEKETEKETVKETEKETEKETVKETEKETVKETESETESETKAVVELEYTTVIDGFKDGEWSYVYDPTNKDSLDKTTPGTIAQEVFINGNNAIAAKNRSAFRADYAGEKFDLSYGFKLKVTTDWQTTVEADAKNLSRYWGATQTIRVGDMAFVMLNAFHEYYNGAAPVIFRIYEEFDLPDEWISNDGGTSPDALGVCVAEYYTEAWAHNEVINEDVNYYLNTTLELTYNGSALSVTIANGAETVEWELWDGSVTTDVDIAIDLSAAEISLCKGWGGYHETNDGHEYFKDFVLQQASPKTAD